MNETEVEIPCAFWWKAVYPDRVTGVMGCYPILDLVAGWKEIWLSISISTVLIQFALVAWTAHDLYRLWKCYKKKLVRMYFTNPLFFAQLVSGISSLLMAIAWVDPWGLYGIYNHIFYLAIYAPAYGGIPAHTCIIAIYIFTVVVWRALKKDADPYTGLTIVGIIAVSVVVLYAGAGYPIFGWVLAAAFKKNPNTKLGPIGNYLAYAMYGLVMLVSFCVGIGSSIVLTMHEKVAINKQGIILTRGRITRWCSVNFVASAFFLGLAINYQFRSKDESLMSTFVILGLSRMVEIILQINTNTFQDAQFIEGGYLSHFIALITREEVDVIERGDSHSATRTARLSKIGSTTRVSKHTTTSSGDTTDRDNQVDTADSRV